MIIRPVLPTDLKQITSIDLCNTTTRGWQMEQRSNGEEIATYFRAIRLPREIRVELPQDWRWTDNWQKSDLFVAMVEGPELWGYLELTVEAARNIAWISHLAVDARKRHNGIGSTLVKEAKRWSQARRLTALMAETQTKNYPAIEFLRTCGFVFCGFNDRYYPSKDIAVFFSYGLG